MARVGLTLAQTGQRAAMGGYASFRRCSTLATIAAPVVDFVSDESGVDPDRVALILFDAYLGVLYRWVLDETDQLALGEQLTATLDLILPAIIRTSSVDTNGPSHRTGQTRRTS